MLMRDFGPQEYLAPKIAGMKVGFGKLYMMVKEDP